MRTTEKRLDQIYGIVTSEDFLARRGLGNEISFFIFDYDPEDELLVRAHIEKLVSRLNSPSSPRRVIEFNLYAILLEILQEENLLDGMASFEKEYDREYVQEAISSLAAPDVYVELINKRFQGYEMIFLTGIGMVWPFIRSHTVLNNLHFILEKTPLVMFFPGRYDGVELRLFSKIGDDNYYRAFPLIPR
ncbi:MAG: DUF1788 domain-containing protein [Firmicutes bacterium]|nr:DUF1788 domain-containing protein [Bacillota bacterium]